MDFEKKIEYILTFLIIFFLTLAFWPDKKIDTVNQIQIDSGEFDKHPLVAWKSTHKRWDCKEGDIVKIKYRVTKPETKLWVYDDITRKLVLCELTDRYSTFERLRLLNYQKTTK